MKIQAFAPVLLLVLSLSTACGQKHLWSDGSALTIPERRFETGFFLTPARYGIDDSLEISSYLLWDYFIPNIAAKKFWGSNGDFLISTTHCLYSPTPFLRFVSREKTGGLLPPDNYVPFFIVLDSYLLASYEVAEGHYATARVGGKFAFAPGDRTNDYPAYRRLQTIDYPFIFPRTAFLTKTPAFAPDGGLSGNGPLIWRLQYETSLDFFYFSTRDNLREEDFMCWAVEWSAALKWHISRSVSGRLGVVYSTGTFPFGHTWVFYPLLDIQFGFGGLPAS
jgi:hypothetical protein